MTRVFDETCVTYEDINRAVFSSDKRYRYILEARVDPAREWPEDKEFLTGVFLNPSTADHRKLDATLRRFIGFARREAFLAVRVLNLFAQRATDPRELARSADPVGPDNDEFLRRYLWSDRRILVGWGNHGGLHGRSKQIEELLPSTQAVICLGLTDAGEPKHPLRLAKDTPMMPYWDRKYNPGRYSAWPLKGRDG